MPSDQIQPLPAEEVSDNDNNAYFPVASSPSPELSFEEDSFVDVGEEDFADDNNSNHDEAEDGEEFLQDAQPRSPPRRSISVENLQFEQPIVYPNDEPDDQEPANKPQDSDSFKTVTTLPLPSEDRARWEQRPEQVR